MRVTAYHSCLDAENMLFYEVITALLPSLTWVDICYLPSLALLAGCGSEAQKRLLILPPQWSKPAPFWQSSSEREWSVTCKLSSGLHPKERGRTFFTPKLSLSSSFGKCCTYPSITLKLNVEGWRIIWPRVRSSEVLWSIIFSWNLDFWERSSWLWGVLKTSCKL